MNKVFCFGEILLRMSPTLGGEWIRAAQLPVYLGGAELNVASALAKWAIPVRYGTALPDNAMSADIVQALQLRNIDVSGILLSGNKIGIYYLPAGADLKNTGVIYDRADSSFAGLNPGHIDWDLLLQDCSWFHFSAISPALNRNVQAVCLEGLKVAREKKMTISVDLNYRRLLWQADRSPVAVLSELVSYCDLVMGNIWSAESLLGIPVDPHIHSHPDQEVYHAHASRTSRAIFDRFPICKAVANTFRFDQGNGIDYFATLDTEAGQFVSPTFTTDNVVDKVGSGDCFMAGWIYGSYLQHPPQELINYAAAAAFGKLQERGDATQQTIESVNSILRGL